MRLFLGPLTKSELRLVLSSAQLSQLPQFWVRFVHGQPQRNRKHKRLSSPEIETIDRLSYSEIERKPPFVGLQFSIRSRRELMNTTERSTQSSAMEDTTLVNSRRLPLLVHFPFARLLVFHTSPCMRACML